MTYEITVYMNEVCLYMWLSLEFLSCCGLGVGYSATIMYKPIWGDPAPSLKTNRNLNLLSFAHFYECYRYTCSGI